MQRILATFPQHPCSTCHTSCHEAYRWSDIITLLCIYFMHFQYCGIIKLVEMLFTVVLYAFSTLNNCHYTITRDTCSIITVHMLAELMTLHIDRKYFFSRVAASIFTLVCAWISGWITLQILQVIFLLSYMHLSLPDHQPVTAYLQFILTQA
jgi:hypothetical protein